MKRTGNLFYQMCEPDNLRLAFWKAKKGKSGSEDVLRFAKNLDQHLLAMQKSITAGTIEIGNYHYFRIFDPKERLICAASFPERILHHALMNVCHNAFESFQIADSYACRLNKGTFAALDRATYFQNRFKWFLKLDVRKYFDNINHNLLFSFIARRIKDYRVLRLFERIIDSYQSKPGCGVPIGNLTSQYFANHYLALADHFAKETLMVPGYVRYMDDMALWSNEPKKLIEYEKQFIGFLNETLQLQTKPSIINKSEHGITFLGFRVFPNKVLLSQRSKKRFSSKLLLKMEEVENGWIDQKTFSQSVMALYGFVGHANSLGFRKKTIQQPRTCATGSNRVLRGGSWNNNASNCTVSNRNNNNPTNSNNNNGFRLVIPAHSSNDSDGFRSGEQACVSLPNKK